ncbi:hypothetical protein HJC23_012616 [Cyclotella cryptica]|uniref:Rad51-like C-terminal domain-containing protein n=1 Tax=Cyclotella cryptica TaxID=29204 RepID=A0ABD3QNK3_9STRA|eukprot:CCRYP_004142-RA/>CCRYP_004142-RA protein AED:0.00 eAED:0.00 QI:150/1/1/1/0/0/3/1125/524
MERQTTESPDPSPSIAISLSYRRSPSTTTMASETPQSPSALNSAHTMPPQPTTAAKVVNPYLKVSAKNERVAVASAKTKLMQKYSIRCRDRVDSMSAMELLRRRRRWRGLEHQQQNSESVGSLREQEEDCDDSMGNSHNDSHFDCPRLFLFGHRISGSKSISNCDENDNINNQSNGSANINQSKCSFNKDEERAFLLEHNITELSGEAGSGKTQICLSVCVDCVTIRPAAADLPDKNGVRSESQTHIITSSQPNTTKLSRDHHTNPLLHYKAVYISTGSNTSTIAKRLESMVRARLMNQSKKRGHPSSRNATSVGKDQIHSTLSKIYLVSMKNEEDLLDFIQHSLPSLLSRGGHDCISRNKSKIGIIVIDDIASLFRFSDPSLYYSSHTNSTFIRDRTGNLFFISSQLRKLAHLYGVPVLVTNQVSAAIGSSLVHWFHGSNKEGVVPALGLVWSHCVGTRIILRRGIGGTAWMLNEDEKKEQLNGRERSYGSLRYARAVKAVNMPSGDSEVKFVIGTGEVGIIS